MGWFILNIIWTFKNLYDKTNRKLKPTLRRKCYLNETWHKKQKSIFWSSWGIHIHLKTHTHTSPYSIMQRVCVVCNVCAQHPDQTPCDIRPAPYTNTHVHTLTYAPPPFLQHTHTLYLQHSTRHTLIHPADSDSVFNVATLSCHISFLSATLSLSLFLLCAPSVVPSSPLPSLHPINNCWHFLPQLRKKQLKAIDSAARTHTLPRGRARATHTRTHTQAQAHAGACVRLCRPARDHEYASGSPWPSKAGGKPGDFILHGTATGYVSQPLLITHAKLYLHKVCMCVWRM